MYNSQLATFVCVADCGSFNKAAEKLFISPPAVMKQINVLEDQLALKLFVRTRHGIRLTAAGESIYQDAKHLIAYSDKAVEKARNMVVDAEFTLCVATSLLNPCKPFVDLWSRIEHRFPEYKLHIVPFDDDNEGILSVIRTLGKSNDFVVGICDSDLWLERCSFHRFGEYRRGYAVPVAHRLAAKKTLRIEDLYGETLAMCKGGNSPLGEWDDIERNHPQIKITETPCFYDMEVFNLCVRTGGILSTAECWKDIHPSLVTIPREPESTVPYGLMYVSDPPQDILQIVEAIKALGDRDVAEPVAGAANHEIQ